MNILSLRYFNKFGIGTYHFSLVVLQLVSQIRMNCKNIKLYYIFSRVRRNVNIGAQQYLGILVMLCGMEVKNYCKQSK